MPAAAAIPWLGTAIAGGAAATAGVVGSKLASNATNNAANITQQTSDKAIALQQQQDAETTREFNQQQAMAQQQWNAQQQVRAPYRAAGQQSLVRLGQLLGTTFNLPADSGGGSASNGTPAATMAGIDWTKPDPTKIAAYLTANGGDPSEAAYFVSRASDLYNRGQQLGDPNYADKRLAAADSILAKAGTPATAAATPSAGDRKIIPMNQLVRS